MLVIGLLPPLLVVLVLLLASAAHGAPRVLGFRVAQTFEHDTSAFTEGLLFRDGDGSLLESTGLSGQSLLREFRVDESTGTLEALRSVRLPDQHFGEGIAVLGRQIVALTWKSGKAHVVDRHSLELRETLDLDPRIKEGWGLAQSPDREALLMSDGSSVLHVLARRGNQLEAVAHVPVHDCANNMPFVAGINELELVPRALSHPRPPRHVRGAPPGAEELARRRGGGGGGGDDGDNSTDASSADLVWGNIITTMCVALIDPRSGSVEAWLLLDGIYDGWDAFNKVANGIAYRATDDSLWITGKDWSKLFKIELVEHGGPVDIREKCTTRWSGFSYDLNAVLGKPPNSPCRET
jgi:glutamine cyclotransferase